MFSIDKFTGVLSVTRPVDRELSDKYDLKITASDGAHRVETATTVIVKDVNDNAPVFDEQVYLGSFSTNMTLPAGVVKVHADDADSDRNGQVRYSLLESDAGFVDENGTIYLNNTKQIQSGTEVHLVVMAEDNGDPRQKSFASVRLQNLQHSDASPEFKQDSFDVIIDSRAKIGTKLANLGLQQSAANLFYSLESVNPYFELDSSTGDLILKKRVLHDSAAPALLQVIVRRDSRLAGEKRASIRLNYRESGAGGGDDLFPIFQRKYYDVKLSERAGVGTVTDPIFVLPGDNSKTKYDLGIAAGNVNNTFQVSRSAGGEVTLVLKKSLDYERRNEYKLLVSASRGNIFDTATIVVTVTDENDNAPEFAVDHQIHSVRENMSPGSPVFTARAIDQDQDDVIKYSITSEEFSIGETNGRVVTNRKFDYESEKEFSFVLTATDLKGRVASAEVLVKIESEDEYAPVFERPSYKYTLDRELPVGHIIGRVHATDQDSGPDGRVVYSLVTGGHYFTVSGSGDLQVLRPLDTGLLVSADTGGLYQEVSLTVVASTDQADSLRSSALIILDVKTDVLPPAPLPSTQSGLAGWGTGLIVTVIIILIILAMVFVFRKYSVNDLLTKRRIDPNSSGAPVSHYNNSLSDTLESGVTMSQYPPQYSDIVSQYGGGKVTRQRPEQLSDTGHSHRSASSGRGSAEEGEEEVDHEIQMINGGNINDSTLPEDSRSDISVQNGKVGVAVAADFY